MADDLIGVVKLHAEDLSTARLAGGQGECVPARHGTARSARPDRPGPTSLQRSARLDRPGPQRPPDKTGRARPKLPPALILPAQAPKDSKLSLASRFRARTQSYSPVQVRASGPESSGGHCTAVSSTTQKPEPRGGVSVDRCNVHWQSRSIARVN